MPRNAPLSGASKRPRPPPPPSASSSQRSWSGAPSRQRATSTASATVRSPSPAVGARRARASGSARMRAHSRSWASDMPGADAMTPSAFLSEPDGGEPIWQSGAPKRSETRPPRARITASGAAVSHKEVPKCITARSHAPSATDKILVPAPPTHTAVPPSSSATVFAAASSGFFESPVVTIGAASDASRHDSGRAPTAPAPAPARPYTAAASAPKSPAGKGRPIAPATERPPTATPTSDCTFARRSSTYSRVPSSGSTKIVTASSATLAAPASSGHRSRRRLGTSSGRSDGAESSSSPMMWTPGHAFCSAATIAACAARSASVRYWPASSCSSFASMIVSAAAPPLTRCACTRRISAQPRSEASTHVLSSSSSLTLCGDAMVKAWAGRRSQEAINCSAAAGIQASSDAARRVSAVLNS